MACDEATMAFETQFLTLLQASRFYTVRGDTLTVFGAVGEGALLVFDAAPRNPLLGKWTVDSYGVPPSTVVAVLPDTEIDVVFGIGTVGGFAGCNSFSGTYGTNGTVVRISRLATTRLACDEAVMEQETAFLEALQGAALVESRGSTLNLTDRNGGIVVALARPSRRSPARAPVPRRAATPEATATPAPTAEPDAHARAHPQADCQAEPDAQADGRSDTHAHADCGARPPHRRRPRPRPSRRPPRASCRFPGSRWSRRSSIPGTWSTVTEPAELACRYFDAVPITVPADPATLDTPIRADILATPYQEAVTAATDAANWTVATKSEFNVRGAAVTCIGAIATTEAAGIPVGQARYACLANVQTAGTVAIWATGAPDDEVFLMEAAVVNQMTLASTFTPPG